MGVRQGLVRGMVVVAAVVAIGCGSTSPVSPSPSPPSPSPSPGPAPAPQPTQFPSVVGALWFEDASRFTVRYLEGTTPTHYSCDARMSVQTQTGGRFTGNVIVEGISPDSDRYCTISTPFTAEMALDGAITAFSADQSFRCLSSAYQTGVGGTATHTTMRIEVTWRAICPDPAGRSRDTEFSLTLSVWRAAPLRGE